jgi:hypothetical protein
MFHLKRSPLTTSREHLHAQNDETNGSIEFVQPDTLDAAGSKRSWPIIPVFEMRRPIFYIRQTFLLNS